MGDQATSTKATTYELPPDITEKLLCARCNSYVSCGPVKIESNGATVCGRCSDPNDKDGSQQSLYETAMTSFMFPCRYKPRGCTKRVLFNHAIEHENNCPYKTVYCPALPHGSCARCVSAFDVHDHFKESHEDLILEEGKFKLEFQEDIQRNLLMVEDNSTVVVQYSYDSNNKILKLNVPQFSHDDQQIVHYKLKIISGNDSDNSINLKERPCCFYESYTINLQNVATLVMDSYMSVLENPSFVYICVKLKVDSVKKEMESNFESIATSCEPQSDNQYEKLDLVVWSELEHIRCYYCKAFAVPPFNFFSSERDCVCSNCKINKKVKQTHEKIVKITKYPCRWWGCSFMGNDENIAAHVDYCQYRNYLCPLANFSCEGYYTRDDMMKHMERHGTYCPNPEYILINVCMQNECNVQRIYFTIFDNVPIAFIISVASNRQWQLTGSAHGFQVDGYFQHDHCRFKTKTCSLKGLLEINSSTYSNFFPNCFEYTDVKAVLKLTKLN